MKKLLISFIIAVLTQNVYAATFNTFSNGVWTNAPVWAGGSFPGSVSGRDLTVSGKHVVNVDHVIQANNHLILNGNKGLELNVNPGSDLTVAGNVIIPQNQKPTINVIGTATDFAFFTIQGNLEANAQLEINVENGVLRIEGDMLGANNANIKLNVLENGILYIKENLDINNNVNFSFDGAGTILIDGDMDMQGFNSNPLDGIIAVLGTVNSTTNIQKRDDITLWGDNFDANSVGNDARRESGISGPAEGTYADFATNFPDLCAYSDYCNTTYQNPLPVTFIAVDATLVRDDVVITWSTAQEENNDYFEIEKSIDAKSWSYVGSVEGAGNSNSVIKYEFVDNAKADLVYYRIKQVDYDGQFAYSDVVYVASEKIEKELKAGVYPNPNNGAFYFQLEDNHVKVNSVEAINVNGEVVGLSFTQSENIVKINDDAGLAMGYYNLKVQTEKGIEFHSFFIN